MTTQPTVTADVYLPVAVPVRSDGYAWVLNGVPRVDFEGAPWQNVDREPNVFVDGPDEGVWLVDGYAGRVDADDRVEYAESHAVGEVSVLFAPLLERFPGGVGASELVSPSMEWGVGLDGSRLIVGDAAVHAAIVVDWQTGEFVWSVKRGSEAVAKGRRRSLTWAKAAAEAAIRHETDAAAVW